MFQVLRLIQYGDSDVGGAGRAASEQEIGAMCDALDSGMSSTSTATGWGEQVEFLSATLYAVTVASAMAAPLAAGHEGDGDA